MVPFNVYTRWKEADMGKSIKGKELRKRMREEQYEDEKALNVVTKDVTLDEWYEICMNTCKKNCRNSTKNPMPHIIRGYRRSLDGVS